MRLYQRLLPYIVAIGLTAIALLLRLWLEPLLSQTMGSFFYIAILLTTWYGGFRPGLVTVVLSALAIDYFFLHPQHQLLIYQPSDVLQLSIFLLVALSINLLTSNFLKSKQKIQQLNKKLAQENAEQLRMALSAAHMGMWDWNMVTGKINWSPEHEQLFGLAFGSFDGRYETFDQRLHPEDRSILNHAVQRALQTHSIYQCEFRVVWPDHSIHWIEGRGQAFYNGSGEPVRMTGTIMAIDDRKQAQITLQHQFEQQRLVMEMTQCIRKSLNLQDILQTTVDEVRQFLECDRVTIFKFSPSWGGAIVVESVAAEWMPILPLQIYDPCIGEENVEPFKQGLVTAKSDIYHAGISPCHVEFLASLQVRANLVVPVFQGNKLWGLLAAHQCAAPREWQTSEIDLLRQLGVQLSIAIQQAALFEQVQTELIERQQAEQTLAKEALRIRTLFNTSFDGIVILNGQGNVIDVNPRFTEMLGYTLEETAKLNIADWDAQFTPEELQQLQRDNLKSGVLETRHRRKDGSIYDVEISFNILEWEGENLGFCVCRDITERKQAQINLQQREATLRLFAQYAPAGIAMFDRDMRYLTASQRWVDDYCLDSIAALIGRSHYEIFPEISQEWRQIHQRCLAGASEKCDEDLYVRLDGTQHWLRWEIHPWHTARGEVGGIIIFSDDITQYKQAKIALQQLNSELEQRVAQRTEELNQYERIVSNTKDGIALLNHDYNYQIVNQTYLDWYNKTDGEVLGHSVKEIVGQTFFDSFVQPRLDRCLAGENIQYEKWFDYPNRPLQFMSVTYAPYREQDGTISGVIVSLRDITKLQKAEEALRQSEEKFRQLAENIQAVFWMTDIQTHQILYVSPAYETIWQRTCQSLYQNFFNWLDAIHPDDRQHVEIAFTEQLRTGQYDVKYRIIRPDGSMRWIRDRAFPIKNELGKIVRMAGIAEDITELQKVEQMKSEFIGIVSHELRTPLTSIHAAMGLLKTGVYAQKPDKSQRMVEIAAIESERLVRLVNDILDLERLESGRAVLEKTTCNAADLIEQAVEGVQAIAKQQNISFNIHVTDTQVWAAADAIIQTLTNLLGNAIKFSPADATITLSVQQQTNHVLFQVSDQGRGIPADKLEAVFGRFQQVDATDSRAKGGTGLGLAICRSIIDQHSGKIWVESIVGVGSTFFFTLPVNS